jgi:pimeloyl-ACP methyl ester carboxylesterase
VAAAGWTALTLDARGHGDSDWAPYGDYSMDALIRDLAAVTQRFPNPVLIGASMGGMTALIAAGEGRVRTRGVVLVDVAPRIEQRGVDRIRDFMQANRDGFATLSEVEQAIAAYNPHRRTRATEAGLRRTVRRHEDGRWYWHWDPAFMAISDDEPRRRPDLQRVQAAARNLNMPVLLVRGAQSDVLSPEGVREFLELVPHAEFVDVKGAGHMVAGDDNDVFGRAVLDFLDRLKPVE